MTTGSVAVRYARAILQLGEEEGVLAQLQREINLASGAETASSVALEEQAAPLILAIAEQLGPAAEFPVGALYGL